MNIHDMISGLFRNKNFTHGMLYTVFSFINSGISFILLLILAKFLTPFDYGQLNLFTTLVTLVNIIITLSTTSYIAVSFFQKNTEHLRQIILIALVTTTIMLGVLSLILLFFPNFVEKSIGISYEFIWLGLSICYFQVFNTLNLDIWRLEEKPFCYGFYSISFAVCNFLLSFVFIVGMKLGWEGRVYAWWLLGIIYFFLSIVFLIKRRYLVIIKPSSVLIRETLFYALPLLPHTASFWLKQGLDRYIINYYHEQTAVGYFSFAMNLAAIIGIVGTAFNATNSVFIFKKLSEGFEKVKGVLYKQTKIMTLGFFIVSFIVGLLAYGLIHWGLPRYAESIQYILPLCIGGFFQCLYLLWVNYLFFYKKTKQLMCITLSTAILQVLLSVWLTRYSVLYTAYISMIITGITAWLVISYTKKEIKYES